jgi:hypothetical protein
VALDYKMIVTNEQNDVRKCKCATAGMTITVEESRLQYVQNCAFCVRLSY